MSLLHERYLCRAFWCCEQAPRGWQLFHLLLPWIMILMLCSPCLSSAMGEPTAQSQLDWLHCSVRLDEEAASYTSVGRTAVDDFENAEVANIGTERNDLSKTREELLSTLCTLTGSSIWGSQSLSSHLFQLFVLRNEQGDTKLTVSRLLTSIVQFSAIHCQKEFPFFACETLLRLAHETDSSGKTQLRIVLEASRGYSKIRTLQGCNSPITEFYAALCTSVLSKSEWQETILLTNPFAASLCCQSLWMGPAIGPVTGKGLWCRIMDPIPDCCHCSGIELLSFTAEGCKANSLVQAVDLIAAMVSISDDEERFTGTLFLNICGHSVQQPEVLLVAVRFTGLFWKDIFLEIKESEIEYSTCCHWKDLKEQLQATNVSGETQKDNLLVNLSTEILGLECGMIEEIGSQNWTEFGCLMPHKIRFGLAMEFFMAVKELMHFKSVTNPIVMVLRSVLLPISAEFEPEDTGSKDSYLTIGCIFAEDSCFDGTPSEYEVGEIGEGFMNSCLLEITFTLTSKYRFLLWRNNSAIFSIAALCPNEGLASNESSKRDFWLAMMFPVNLVEVKNKDSVLDLLGPVALYVESWKAGPDSAMKWFTRPCVACKPPFLSTSAASADVFMEDNIELAKVAFKLHNHRINDQGTSPDWHNSFFLIKQQVIPKLFLKIESGVFNVDLKDKDIERALAGGYLKLHSCSLKEVMADNTQCVHPPSSSKFRYKKFVLRASLLILILAFILPVFIAKQEKYIMTESKSHNLGTSGFFLDSFFYIKCAEILDILKYAHRRYGGIDRRVCAHVSKLLTKAARGFSIKFRGLVNSETTVLNVRVHISESPCSDEALNYSRNSFLLNNEKCSLGLNSAKQLCSYQTSSSAKTVDPNNLTDQTRSKLFNFSTVTRVETSSAPNDYSLTPSPTVVIEDADQSFQVKERKSKGRRRKKGNNMVDLKQGSDRIGQSASSSPPSSPASPATPIAYGIESPFLQSDSLLRSVRVGSNSYGLRSSEFHDHSFKSSQNQFLGEVFRLDVPRDHTCNVIKKKGAVKPRHNFDSKLPSKPSVKVDLPRKVSVSKISSKELCTTENWAAVARRAIGSSNQLDQSHELASSPRSLTKGSKPVLLPSATFPQSGRSLQWNPWMLESTKSMFSDSVASPSLVSTSLIAPHARAPGSRPSRACNEKSEGATSRMNTTFMDTNLSQGCQDTNNEFLYDIWGDHFAEFSCNSKPKELSRLSNCDIEGESMPVCPGGEGPFAVSSSVCSNAIAAASCICLPSSEAFSIFSENAFYSPPQLIDAMDDFTLAR